MVVSGNPIKGGLGSIFDPPEGKDYKWCKWYILPIGGLYGTYHLVREPETTIDFVYCKHLQKGPSLMSNLGSWKQIG